MAKIDRSILQANDQSMGQYGDPDKIESSITHLADKIDENDNGFNSHKDAAELAHPDKSVTERKLADDSVSRRTIQPGAIGADELDDALMDFYDDIAVKAQLVSIEKKADDWYKKPLLNSELFSLKEVTIANSSYNHFGLLHKTRDGLILFHYEGQNHMNSAGKITMRKSYDGGATFTDYKQLVSDANDNRGIGGCVLPNGRILLVFTKTNVGATATIGHYSMYSDDNGATWSSPVKIAWFDYSRITLVYGKAIVINKMILQPYYRYLAAGTEVGVLKSSDNGETWTQGAIIYTGSENVSECSIENVGNEVFAVIRNESKSLKQLYSSDGGNTFAYQREMTFSGEYPVSPYLQVIRQLGKYFVFVYYHDRDSSTLKRRHAPIEHYQGTRNSISSAKIVKSSLLHASGYPSTITDKENTIKILVFNDKDGSKSDILLINERIPHLAEFESEWTPITKNTSYNIAHTLGKKPERIEVLVSQDPNSYPILNNADTIKTATIGTSVRVDQTNCYVGCGLDGILAYFAGSPPALTTVASGFIKIRLY